MFEHEHYVPVMRTKPAELRALKGIDPALRSRITPLLECPRRVLRGCDTVQKLEHRLAHIVGHVTGWAGRSLFLDFTMLLSTLPLELMAARTAQAGIRPVLVTSLKTGS